MRDVVRLKFGAIALVAGSLIIAVGVGLLVSVFINNTRSGVCELLDALTSQISAAPAPPNEPPEITAQRRGETLAFFDETRARVGC